MIGIHKSLEFNFQISTNQPLLKHCRVLKLYADDTLIYATEVFKQHQYHLLSQIHGSVSCFWILMSEMFMATSTLTLSNFRSNIKRHLYEVQSGMMAKVEKDSSCAKCNYVTISNYRHLLTLSAFHSVHTPNCPVQPLGECISHNRRAFLNCSSAQVNSFAFHELPVKLALPRTGMSLTPVRHYATYHTDAR